MKQKDGPKDDGGIPGTGLGGLFYLGLYAWACRCERSATVRAELVWRRWKFIITQWLLVAGMHRPDGGSGVVLKRARRGSCRSSPKERGEPDLQTVVSSAQGWRPPTRSSLSILIAIVLLVQMARLGVMLADQRQRGPVIAR